VVEMAVFALNRPRFERLASVPERPKLAPERFFRDLRPGNEDREDQVAALQNVMNGELRNLEGFRVGEIQINIFVLGTDGSGKAVGLRTLSVET
jgi:Cdc6-like AAA superfamily ATPase